MFTKFALLLAIAATNVIAAPNPTCAQDNCLRAVIGSNFPTRAGTADCSSYLLTTVTPAVVTVTSTALLTTSTSTTTSAQVTKTTSTTATQITQVVTTISSTLATVTQTVTVTAGPAIVPRDFNLQDLARVPGTNVGKRQVTVAPLAIPAYATPCSGRVRYTSACSCIGVTARTIIAPVPTTTVIVSQTATAISTITVTQTVTATEIASTLITETIPTILSLTATATATEVACPTNAFKLRAVGGSFAGQFATISMDQGGNGVIVFQSLPFDSAPLYSLDSANHLINGNRYANIDAGRPASVFYFNTIGEIVALDYVYTECTLGGANALGCVNQGLSVLQTCGGVANSGSGVAIAGMVLSGCVGFTFEAVC